MSPKTGIALVFACALAVVLSGCAIPRPSISFYGRPANYSGAPLDAIQVSFDPTLPKVFALGAGTGYTEEAARKAAARRAPEANRSAAEDGARLVQVFSNGFQ